jgi:hypothetical protein
VVHDDAGQEVGGLICFVEEGLLSYLEVYAWETPLPLPPVERVEWAITSPITGPDYG